jgi:hypothetical protein
MGPVSEPAYPDTSISARSLEALEALGTPEIVPETIDETNADSDADEAFLMLLTSI